MPREGRLPGTTEPDPSIVLHVDMDAFYANCERRREPALEGEPVVVGMGYEPGETIGAVATASYEAREYGVESAQPISEALDRLPRADADPEETSETGVGFYRSVDHEFYESVAADVKAILQDLADAVREVSIDEAYLDVTDRTAWSVADGFGRHVKQRIAREVGVPASVGVAPNMSVAKVASDHDKPDGLTVVEPDDLEDFLHPLPIEDLHGVLVFDRHQRRLRTVLTFAESPGVRSVLVDVTDGVVHCLPGDPWLDGVDRRGLGLLGQVVEGPDLGVGLPAKERPGHVRVVARLLGPREDVHDHGLVDRDGARPPLVGERPVGPAGHNGLVHRVPAVEERALDLGFEPFARELATTCGSHGGIINSS